LAASSARAIDISRLLDERAISKVQWLVALLSALIMLVDGYDVAVMSLSVPLVASQWGISPARFGVALSAVLVGLSVGAAFIAPLGDRVGRRTLLIAAMTLIGVTTAVTASAASPAQFVFWRFLTGMGLGMSIPNCNAWTAEFLPVRARATILVIMNAAINAGGFAAGFLLPVIFTRWGWRGAFLIGGVLPLLIGTAILTAAPESLKFLVARRPQDPRIGPILRRVAPEVDPTTPLATVAAVPQPSRWSVVELVAPEYRRRTLVLWGVVIANLFTLYVLVSWLPTLLQSAGWPLNSALRGAAMIQAGGVLGGLVLSVFLSRGQTVPALFALYVITALCLAFFRFAPPVVAWLALVLIGAGTGGAQLALNALSTAYYPPAIKATGMSWAGVVGNAGSFLAPVAGAWVIMLGFSAVNILSMIAAPALACAFGVLLMRREWQWN
jgi:AAHS family 4-hydroxybenzoate transporter-like MFS transporter